MNAWTTIETTWGTCGIRWADTGVTGLCLPDSDRNEIEADLRAVTGSAHPTPQLPDWLGKLANRIRTYFDTQPTDFSDIPLEFPDSTPFARRVYQAARAIPPGEIASYGELAERVGKPGAARAVGTALGRNPIPLLMPCHRIVARSGRLGGFSSPGGIATKERLLDWEGAPWRRSR